MVKTILLTGATGFLGSHLLERLLDFGYKVIILKRSFSNTSRIEHLIDIVKVYDVDMVPVEKAFEEQDIDTVIHTATNYGRNSEAVSQIVDDNLVFSLKVLEAAATFGVSAFFNTDTLQTRHLSNYTLSKKQFVEWLNVFSDSKRIKVVNLKLEHMYGPGDDAKKFVVWLMEQMLSDNNAIDLTKGEQKRDFVYIDDIVNAYLLLLQQVESLPCMVEFDVGTGTQVTIRDFVLKLKDSIESRTGKSITPRLNFGTVPYRDGEVMEVVEHVKPLFDIGWKPKMELSKGIDMLVDEFIEREDYL